MKLQRLSDTILTAACVAVYVPLEMIERAWVRVTHACTAHVIGNDNGDIECGVCHKDLTA